MSEDKELNIDMFFDRITFVTSLLEKDLIVSPTIVKMLSDDVVPFRDDVRKLVKDNEFLKKKLQVLQEQNMDLVQEMENVKADFETGSMR